MCGRYGRRSDKQYIAEHYAMRRKIADLPPMPPGYNITPGTFQQVVRLSEKTGEREMSLMEWGLVPYCSTMHKMVSSIIFPKPTGPTPEDREKFIRDILKKQDNSKPVK
jgi:putative SOS response-associated peptidase YedK